MYIRSTSIKLIPVLGLEAEEVQTTTQLCTRLRECHVTFKTFQTLIAVQSRIAVGNRLERNNFDLSYVSILVPRNMVESSPSNSRDLVQSSTLRSNSKVVILETKN